MPRTTRAAADGLAELARRNAVFAIRSGGHSSNSGFSSTSRGVLINLSQLNAVRYDPASGTAVVGPGATWVSVYRALQSHGVTVAGGRVASVGVGGYTGGGGLSFQLYREGFGADTVVAYEVVLADGRIVTATRHGPHADLFRALKGSGAPFCLVAAFTFRTIRLPDPRGIYGGTMFSSAANIGPTLDAVADFTQPGAGTADPSAHLITTIVLYSTNATANATANAATTKGVGTMVGNTFFYLTPERTTPAVFRGLEAAAKMGGVRSSTLSAPRSVANLTVELDTQYSIGVRSFMMPLMVRAPTRAVLHALHRIWDHEWAALMELSAARQIPGLGPGLGLMPLGRNVSSPTNVMGLAPGVEYFLFAQAVAWRRAADDAAVHRAMRSSYARCTAYLKSVGHYHPWMQVSLPYQFLLIGIFCVIALIALIELVALIAIDAVDYC